MLKGANMLPMMTYLRTSDVAVGLVVSLLSLLLSYTLQSTTMLLVTLFEIGLTVRAVHQVNRFRADWMI